MEIVFTGRGYRAPHVQRSSSKRRVNADAACLTSPAQDTEPQGDEAMGHDHEGRRVSRRSIFAGISAIGLGSLLAACGDGTPATTTSGEAVSPDATTSADLTGLFTDANTCKLSPSTTQGPYYFDADKIRSDIREDRAGTRLRVVLKVQDSEQCKPLTNAVVEIWHCDAAGLYSGAESLSSGDEALNTKVFAAAPYAAHTGRDTFNDGDGIFQDSMLMKVTEDGDGHLAVLVLAADSDADGS